MEITETLYAANRDEWRVWLEKHHSDKKEIWLIISDDAEQKKRMTYLESVEEALCFGWIDGIAKKTSAGHLAQRFTPRRAKSHWTELNKERARRLIKAGKMTEAGYATLPDLAIESFKIPDDILRELQSDPVVWKNFQTFPDSYQRIRVGYIDEMRKQPAEFEKRLRNFIEKTRQNKQFGITE